MDLINNILICFFVENVLHYITLVKQKLNFYVLSNFIFNTCKHYHEKNYVVLTCQTWRSYRWAFINTLNS